VAIATKSYYRYLALFVSGSILFIVIKPAIAQTTYTNQAEYLKTLWLAIAGSLVFFMNAGFAMLEAGLCQARNSTNVLAKNLIVFCIAIFAFWSIGFGLMFGNGNTWIGQTGFFFQTFTPALLAGNNTGFDSLEILYPQQSWLIVFFFQLVFAGTTATIVSGAMAERVKFWAFFWFSFCLVAIAYPLTGRWAWNPDGWLTSNLNFLDFAGSSVVHSVGGMAGLVGASLIGPRRGWQGYNPDEVHGQKFTARPQTFNHSSLSLSTLGCLILWLGWLGFNAGSVKSIADVPHVIVTTMLGGGAGGIFILFLRGLRYQKATLSLVINGILGGLVSITASSVYVSLGVALLIGAVASLWVIFFEQLLEKLRIDDPVGAIPVHLGCGIWGTLAAGLFANQIPPYINSPVMRFEQIIAQIVGILAINLTTFVLSCSFWLLIGLALYGIESLNNNLKKASVNQDLRLKSATNSNSHNNKNLPVNNFYKYLYFARTALRVSLEEEAQGSDGTFF
jgi:ammonium transporter, Amt family